MHVGAFSQEFLKWTESEMQEAFSSGNIKRDIIIDFDESRIFW